ncbi:uncharacterized protein LOC133825192 [Humulus lupulus]|uniref:uncharacterized protein LOC133825192 n=1 Tax=Humulus lupulus TaxID=3486 RepID=UPI002B402C34|nr:uncharacterized protein LOC133825192 [Humulus lupulus]
MATPGSTAASWADKVDEGDFQTSAHRQWQQFTASKLSFSDQKLEFTEPLFRDGQKYARVDVEEVKVQPANWSSVVICMVLGANPPMAVFEGFIKRVWGHLGIAQIARMTMGLTMVKFNDDATRDHVLENGILQFDRKPVIIRPWTADLSAVCLIRSVPLWIRLHDLGLQYWGSKCLSALVSMIGKPIMVDKFTRERSRVQFVRVLVEIEITDNPPRNIQFLNDHGQIMEQGVEYEWLPIKCKVCSGFGHSMVDCRKELKAHWVKKDIVAKTEVKEMRDKDSAESEGEMPAIFPSATGTEGFQVKNSEGIQLTASANVDKAKGANESKQWHTPKHVATQSKQGLVAGISSLPSEQGKKQLNKFEVLQEQMNGGKEGYNVSNSSYG